MAQEFGSFDEPLKTIRRKERKYPWHQWMNGSVWELIRDEDFPCQIASFIAMLRAKASANGVKVSIRTGINDAGASVIAFRFFEKGVE